MGGRTPPHTNLLDSSTVHRFDEKRQAILHHGLARLRLVAEQPEDQPAERVVVLVLQRRSEPVVDIAQRVVEEVLVVMVAMQGETGPRCSSRGVTGW